MESSSEPAKEETTFEFIAVQSIKQECPDIEEDPGGVWNASKFKVEPREEITIEGHGIEEGPDRSPWCGSDSDVELTPSPSRGDTGSNIPVKTALESSDLSKEMPQYCNPVVCSTPAVLNSKNCNLNPKVLSINKSLKLPDTKNNEFKCPTCGKSLTSHDCLVRHLRMHSDEKHYICEQCEKCFTQRSFLISHLKIHSNVKPHKCEHCGRCFTHRGTLLSHLKNHSGDKPYKCEHCELAFAHRCTLVTHSRIHSGEKPHKCEQCGKCFTQFYSFKRHLRVHSGEKPYKCDQCRKCFSESGNLINHLRIHSGKRNYKCKQCEKCFTHPSTLKRHLRTHSA